jgi:hypothetical protein
MKNTAKCAHIGVLVFVSVAGIIMNQELSSFTRWRPISTAAMFLRAMRKRRLGPEAICHESLSAHNCAEHDGLYGYHARVMAKDD